ncbi:MAG: cupin domain-containing protein [Myxococcota bacterium]
MTKSNVGGFEPVTNVDDAEWQDSGADAPWKSRWKVLTPHMRRGGGKLGVVLNRLAPQSVGCPFHWHAMEDEVFYILSGRGLLRYGNTTQDIGPGDCISCPAGRQVAHQIGNDGDEDLVYLAMGPYEPHEVCGYPDTGKVMVRHTQTVGRLERRDYIEGEPEPPKIFSPQLD